MTPRAPMGPGVCALTLLALLVTSGGCGADVDDHDGLPGGGQGRGEAPSLHVDQTVEARVRGESPARSNYLQNIALCREAGVAMRELGPEEVERVGTTRLQVWIGEGRAAYRVEHFEPVRAGGGAAGQPSCSYHLASRGVHAYFDERRSIRIQLDTDERQEGPPTADNFVWRRASGDETGPDADARRIGGQPCQPSEHPAFPGVHYCTWTAGSPWGYGSTRDEPFAASDLDNPFNATLVLEQDPGDIPRPAYRVTTNALQVGGALDEAMSPRPATAWPAAKARP